MPDTQPKGVRVNEPTIGNNGVHANETIISTTASVDVSPLPTNGHSPMLSGAGPNELQTPLEQNGNGHYDDQATGHSKASSIEALSLRFIEVLEDPNSNGEVAETKWTLRDLTGSLFAVEQVEESLKMYHLAKSPGEIEIALKKHTEALAQLKRLANDKKESNKRKAEDDKRTAELNRTEQAAWANASTVQDDNISASSQDELPTTQTQARIPETWETTSESSFAPQRQEDSNQPAWLTRTEPVKPPWSEPKLPEGVKVTTEDALDALSVKVEPHLDNIPDISSDPTPDEDYSSQQLQPGLLKKMLVQRPGESLYPLDVQPVINDEQSSPNQVRSVREIRDQLIVFSSGKAAFDEEARVIANKQVEAELSLRKRDLINPRKILRAILTGADKSGRTNHWAAKANELKIKTGNAYANVDVITGALISADMNRDRFESDVAGSARAIELSPEIAAESMVNIEGTLREKIISQLIKPAVIDKEESITPEGMQIAVNEFIRENKTDLDKAFNSETTDSVDFSVFLATNIYERARMMRDDIRANKMALEEFDQLYAEKIKIIFANPKWGAETQSAKSWIDKKLVSLAQEKGKSARIKGTILHPIAVAAAVSLATYAVVRQIKSADYRQDVTNPLLLNLTPTLVVGGLFAAMRVNYQNKVTRAQLQREVAETGLRTSQEATTRTAFNESVYNLASFQELTKGRSEEALADHPELRGDGRGIHQLMDAVLDNPSRPNMESLIYRMAELNQRLYVSVMTGSDFVTYDHRREIPRQRFELIEKLAKGKVILRHAGMSQSDFTSLYTKDNDSWIDLLITNKNLKDKDFENFSKWGRFYNAGTRGALAAGTGLAIGAGISFATTAIGLPFLAEVSQVVVKAVGPHVSPYFSKAVEPVASAVEQAVNDHRPKIDTSNIINAGKRLISRNSPTENIANIGSFDTTTTPDTGVTNPLDTQAIDTQAIDTQAIDTQAIDNPQTEVRDVLGKDSVWRDAAIEINDKIWDGSDRNGLYFVKDGDAVVAHLPKGAEGLLIDRGDGNPIWIPENANGNVRLDPNSDRVFESLNGKENRIDDLAKALIDQKELAKYPDGILESESNPKMRSIYSMDGTIEAVSLDKDHGKINADVKATMLAKGELPNQIISDGVSVERNSPHVPPAGTEIVIDKPEEPTKPGEVIKPTPTPTSSPEIPERTPLPTPEPSPTPSPEVKTETPSPFPNPTQEVIPTEKPVTSPNSSASPTQSAPPAPSQPTPDPIRLETSEPSPSLSTEPNTSGQVIEFGPIETPTPEHSEPTRPGDPKPPPPLSWEEATKDNKNIPNPYEFSPAVVTPVSMSPKLEKLPLKSRATKRPNFNIARQQRLERIRSLAEENGRPYDFPRTGDYEKLGWNIYLNLPGNDPHMEEVRAAIKAAADEQQLISADGYEGDKEPGMITIYIGDRDTAVKFANDIWNKFGPNIAPPTKRMLIQDVQMAGNIGGKFNFSKELIEGAKFGGDTAGYSGVTLLNDDAIRIRYGVKETAEDKLKLAALRADAIFKTYYGAFYTGTREANGFFRLPVIGNQFSSNVVQGFKELTRMGLPQQTEEILEKNAHLETKTKSPGVLSRLRNKRRPDYEIDPRPLPSGGANMSPVRPGPLGFIADDDDEDSLSSPV